jgi:hypothetical protein
MLSYVSEVRWGELYWAEVSSVKWYFWMNVSRANNLVPNNPQRWFFMFLKWIFFVTKIISVRMFWGWLKCTKFFLCYFFVIFAKIDHFLFRWLHDLRKKCITLKFFLLNIFLTLKWKCYFAKLYPFYIA